MLVKFRIISAQGINFGTGYRTRFNNVQTHPNEYYTIYTIDYNNYQVKKSTDNGVTWSVIRSLQSGSGWSYSEVKVSPSNGDVIYVSDESGGTNTLHKSTNGGSTWTSILPSLAGNEDIRNIEISGADHNTLWISTNGSNPKVYKSTNGGSSWTDYSAGLGGYDVYSMIHQKGSDGGVYVGTIDGVYYRDNSMSSWEKFGSQLPGIRINFLKINYYKGILRAATGRGIWEIDLASPSQPEASISSNTQSTECGGTEIEFASSSVISNDNPTYSWSFEGGVPSTSNEVRPNVYYPLAGTFDVTLIVTDANGSSTQTLQDYITVTGSCTSTPEIALTNQTGLGSGSCIQEASIDLEVFNKGLPTITNYTVAVYYNDQLEESRNITTTLASGTTETVSFNNLDLAGVAKLEFVVSNPNGTADNTSDNTITNYNPTESIDVPNVTTLAYSSASGGDIPDNMFDGDISTIWHNYWGINAPLPHTFEFDLNDDYNISAIEMLNRQNNSNGLVKDVEIFTSTDGTNWEGPYNWTFESSTSWQTASFANGAPFRYLRFNVTSTISGSNVCSIAELKFRGCNDVLTFINSKGDDSSITVYPNPASNNLQIDGLKPGMKVRVMNTLGLLIYEGSSSTVDVNHLAPGNYFLQVLDGNNTVVKKWIKK